MHSLITGLRDTFFPKELSITPILHLGGQKPNFDCWKEDSKIGRLIAQQAGMSYEKVWADFQNTLNKVLKTVAKTKIFVVLNEATVHN